MIAKTIFKAASVIRSNVSRSLNCYEWHSYRRHERS